MKKGGFLLTAMVSLGIVIAIQIARPSVAKRADNRVKLDNEGGSISKQIEQEKLKVGVREVFVNTNPNQEFESLRKELPTLLEIEREYKNYRADQLTRAYHDSQKKIERLQLISKSNAGPLSNQETKILVMEIRRQGVLAHLQTKEKIEVAKRKYL